MTIRTTIGLALILFTASILADKVLANVAFALTGCGAC